MKEGKEGEKREQDLPTAMQKSGKSDRVVIKAINQILERRRRPRAA